MTTTTHMPENQLRPTSQRWAGAVIGLLIGLAAVCHGCHGGDRDDELSLDGGKPRLERHQNEKRAANGQGERRGLSPPSGPPG